MRPNLHPRLVNGRFGDPALFVERLHHREAILFDCGDLSPLSARDLLRVSHLFISHMHMDHMIGFDALLRVSIGRGKTIRVFGPPGIAERIHHKLQGYEWDLSHRYPEHLRFEVAEIGEHGPTRAAAFSFERRFEWQDIAAPPGPDLDGGGGLRVRTVTLEHHGPCLGFVLSEPAHANVWKNKLAERGLPTGSWLQQLKVAVLAGAPDDKLIALPEQPPQPLATLRDLITLSEGQRIAYVTDVADTPANRTAIIGLAEKADLSFLEARFAAADARQAQARAHLTTTACGEIGRAAGVRRIEPFHFSPRYEGEEERMLAEVSAAFADRRAPAEPRA